LKVNVIADLVEQGKLGGMEKFHVTECIGCGCCSYSCLAGRDLASKVKIAKEAMRHI
jgi:Na+-translocating ferredoxin:NAD+ oxidoreductase RnfC subunit